MNKISINLVTWNGDRYIEDCLRSVFAQTYKDFSIIIIDNGSTDRTLEIINESYPHLKIVKHKENIGFAKAHNQAIHWTKSDYILCLNQDIVLEPDFLEKAVQFMDSESLVGALTGRLQRLQSGEKTKYIDSTGLKIFRSYKVLDRDSGEVAKIDEASEEVFGVSGACPIYRRKALEEVMYQNEYFDEDFFSYKEDVDLAHRLRWAGWQAFYLPSAVAYHDRSVGSEKSEQRGFQIIKNRQKKSKFANYYSYKNHIYFLLKNLPRLSWSVFWYELAKFFYILFFETRTVKGWGEILKNWQKMRNKRKVIMRNKKMEKEDLQKWLN